MPKVKINRGTHRTDDGTVHSVGDVIELSEDKLSRLPPEKFDRLLDAETQALEKTSDTADNSVDDDVDVIEHVEHPDGEGESQTGTTDSESALPDDYDELRQLGAAYSGDEVNGSSSKDELTEFFEGWPAEDLEILLESV